MADPLPLPPGLVLGHRGAPYEAPENTLRSFDLALRRGADGVELDVQRSADGVPVVIHDPTLERTTDGAGPVAALPWAALSRLRAGGEPLPSLEQAARWAVERGAWLNVEIKAPDAEEATLAALAAAGATERAFLSSFDAGIVARLGELAPGARRFLLAEHGYAALPAAAAAAAVRAQGVCLGDDAAHPAALATLRDAGLEVVVWTVDDAARLRALLDAGVSAVITNRPELRSALVRECGSAGVRE